MDILRKELDSIYAAQHLDEEYLDYAGVETELAHAEAVAAVTDGCVVITDASCDRCHIRAGHFCALLGMTDDRSVSVTVESSDEDDIYSRIHPEDLADKRMLEYEFFRMAHHLPTVDRKAFRAVCRLRMRDRDGIYRMVDNSTQICRLSPAGKIWLILCRYDISADDTACAGIRPRIIDCRTGAVQALSFTERRSNILSGREKEVLRLIQAGKPSKQIADILGVSIHTVNRHRQNIISKLSVGNSVEAVTAAVAMRLL